MGGEHAREMITVETVYMFLKDLVRNKLKSNEY